MVGSPRWPAPSRVLLVPAPPARLRLKANESAAAGCAATTFPVFFLNSSGGGRSASPSPQLSGNTPPHAPLGPRRARPLLNAFITKRFRIVKACPPPPPPRPVFPRSLCPGRSAASRWLHSAHPAPLALKRSRTGAGASEWDCGAAAGLCEGSGGKPGVELCRLPAARGRAGRGAQAGPGAQARPRTCPAGSLSAPRIRCASRSPHGQNLVVSTTSCFLGGFAGDQDGQHKQGY